MKNSRYSHDKTLGFLFVSELSRSFVSLVFCMLRIQWLSGEEITRITDRSFLGAGSNWIQVLKRHLHGLTGFSRFRQRLLYNSIELEDAEIPPDGTLQLVILPLVEGHLEELFQMTREDDVQQLEDLLQQQVDPNLMENGQTALHVAVQIGSSRCCSLLIEARADMKTTRFDHLSPLHLAVEQDQLEVLQVLLHWGADKDQPLPTGATPLFLAASMGHLEMVRALIEAAADINQPIHQGSSPLFTACRQGRVDICRLLLQARAEMERAIMANGATALIVASARNHLEIVRLLIEAGANKENSCTDGATALFVASEGNYLEIVNLLVQAGADKDKALETTGKTPLIVAAEQGQLETLCYLMKAGANIQKKSSEGLTALDFAVRGGHSNIVELLAAETTAQSESGAGQLDVKKGSRCIQFTWVCSNIWFIDAYRC